MSISEKINAKIKEIQQQPEHIRLRYVWGAVGISMVLIFTIWLFSVSTSFKQVSDDNNATEDSLDELKQQVGELKKNYPVDLPLENLSKELPANELTPTQTGVEVNLPLAQ